MNHFIFDVDGTLTPSRRSIDDKFSAWLLDFTMGNSCYIVTGSDRAKTLEQVGEFLYNTFDKVYQCAGNDVWIADRHVSANEWKLGLGEIMFLKEKLERSEFGIRTGEHFDERPGLVNFSIVGRGANQFERQAYVQYDNATDERYKIATQFEAQYPFLNAQVAGETGIDISPVGKDKSQILLDFDVENVVFFGDKTEKGGNDYSIAQAIKAKGGVVHAVKDWQETWEILRGYSCND